MQPKEAESLLDLHVVGEQGSIPPEVTGASCPVPAATSQRDERQTSGKNYGGVWAEFSWEALESVAC